MGIKYLCAKCRKELKAGNYHLNATNEIGRKFCDNCGSNRDSLQIFAKEEYIILIKKRDEDFRHVYARSDEAKHE